MRTIGGFDLLLRSDDETLKPRRETRTHPVTVNLDVEPLRGISQLRSVQLSNSTKRSGWLIQISYSPPRYSRESFPPSTATNSVYL
ncbi:Protein of unknown function [Pyronema omphalodes CBS 100304]|uniref:Uncharacterized protein n=1 Tax=Pyronema omphalodes (strain CBS 100304) TaxID=1076935 RepID=U4LEX0_PYROM|nr:Protein of unknown function [Pyronema omphalodes CBS 100304]